MAVDDQLNRLLFQRREPERQGFAGLLQGGFEQPLQGAFGVKNAIDERNRNLFLGALLSGGDDELMQMFSDPQFRQRFSRGLAGMTGISGPTKAASTASRFVPTAARNAGIEYMGQPVAQKSFPLMTGQTGTDFLQGGKQGLGLLRNILANLRQSRTPQQLIQGRIPKGRRGGGQFDKLIPK